MDSAKRRYMRLYFLVLSSQMTSVQMFDNFLSCPASIPTIAYVSSCPKNQEDWEKAAQLKNCESIAVIQNCTTQNKFQYHCLMNRWKNATLEVCAPIFYLQGFCAEYSIQTKQVAENYDRGFECLNSPDGHKCPPRYPSNEAYKYQQCYRYKNETIVLSTKKPSSKDNCVTVPLLIIIALLLLVIVSLVIVMLRKGICCTHFTKGRRRTNTDSEQNRREQNKKDDAGEGNRLLPVRRNDKDVEAEEIPTSNKEREKQTAYLSDETGIKTQGHITIDTTDSKKSSSNDTSTQGEKQGVKSRKTPQPLTVQPNNTESKESNEKDGRTVDDEETLGERKIEPPPRPPPPVNHTSGK